MDFWTSKITSIKVRGNNVGFSTIEITSKKFAEMTWKFVEISLWLIDVISTYRRGFDVVCPLGLVVEYLHRGLENQTIKHTLSEESQKFWIWRSRRFVRKILKDCALRNRRPEDESLQYLAAPPLTKWLLFDQSFFYISEIYNFGLLCVKNIFPWKDN